MCLKQVLLTLSSRCLRLSCRSALDKFLTCTPSASHPLHRRMEQAALYDKTRQSKATASLQLHHSNVSLTLIDCHAHIYPPEFPVSEIDSLLDRAATNGVARIVNVPESLVDARAILSLSQACSRSRYRDTCEGEADEGIEAIAGGACAGGRRDIRHTDADVEDDDSAADCASRGVKHRCCGAASCAARMLCPSVGLHPVQSRCGDTRRTDHIQSLDSERLAQPG